MCAMTTNTIEASNFKHYSSTLKLYYLYFMLFINIMSCHIYDMRQMNQTDAGQNTSTLYTSYANC